LKKNENITCCASHGSAKTANVDYPYRQKHSRVIIISHRSQCRLTLNIDDVHFGSEWIIFRQSYTIQANL